MAREYLLDTNIASYVIKGNFPSIRRRLMRVAMADVYISAVTEGELRYGVARRPGAKNLQRIVEEFLIRATVLPWDSDAAKHYANFRAELERLGRPMGNLDMMIGSHALARGAILVTHDQVFAGIKNLKVEDWTV